MNHLTRYVRCAGALLFVKGILFLLLATTGRLPFPDFVGVGLGAVWIVGGVGLVVAARRMAARERVRPPQA